MGGIQHDIRTFATRLRLKVDKISDPAERESAVTDIMHMISLLDDALLASRAGATELDEELVNFHEIVLNEVSDRRTSGDQVTLTQATDGKHPDVLGDRLALRRIIANLIDNALKYGERAHLILTVQQDQLTLTVDDEGPGFPAEQRSILLEPFTRLEGSRARGSGGAGLGLAIVRSLAEAHGGTVEIQDAPSRGARVVISLPIFRS